MQIIPAINAPDLKEARRQAAVIKKIIGRGGWLHLDAGDGIFSSIKSWGDPVEFESLKVKSFNTEVHLMVENPEAVAEAWLKAGARRLIVHLEALRNSASVLDLCQKHQADLMLAINPETIVENLIPYFRNIKFFQILAVVPGKAGQRFDQSVLEKIIFLRERAPDAKIEVDGGINLETARKVKEAGADMVVSASYVFGSRNPSEALKELQNI